MLHDLVLFGIWCHFSLNFPLLPNFSVEPIDGSDEIRNLSSLWPPDDLNEPGLRASYLYSAFNGGEYFARTVNNTLRVPFRVVESMCNFIHLKNLLKLLIIGRRRKLFARY